jgi:hypothetical protein
MIVADPLKRFHKWKQAGVTDPRGPFFKLMKVCVDPDASAKFRRLKKLAFEAQDLTGEQEFFAQEFRCRRFWVDKPFGQGAGRFWLGWHYGGVANFGRSMIRPFMLWLASIFVFALYYLSQRGGAASGQAWTPVSQWFGGLLNGKACVAGSSDPLSEALYLSFRNAFLKIDWNDATSARRVFGCLYGVEPGGSAVLPLSVSAMSLFQAFVSGGLIFMFLLALRNLLKVR